MVIPLFPRVTGFKVENLWRRGSRGAIRCTARVSRPLRSEESERIERLPDTVVDRMEIVHECGPEEIEDWHRKLVDALTGAAPPTSRRAAVGERRSRRTARKRGVEPPPSNDPAA